MKLYLVQHGEAKSKEEDEKRPLSDQGRQDVERIAAFLKEAGIEAKKVIHSGKLRAEQTAEILAKAVGGAKPKSHDGLNPNDEPGAFAEEASGWTDDAIAAGHLPFMSRLVSLLVTGASEAATVSYQPGSVVCLERPEGDGWVINWMVRPELLK